MSYEERSLVLQASDDETFATGVIELELYVSKAVPNRVRPGDTQEYWTDTFGRPKKRYLQVAVECLGFNNDTGTNEVVQDFADFVKLENILTQYRYVRISATYQNASNHSGGPIKRSGTSGSDNYWGGVIPLPILVRLLDDDLEPQDAGDGTTDLSFTLMSVNPL